MFDVFKLDVWSKFVSHILSFELLTSSLIKKNFRVLCFDAFVCVTSGASGESSRRLR